MTTPILNRMQDFEKRLPFQKGTRRKTKDQNRHIIQNNNKDIQSKHRGGSGCVDEMKSFIPSNHYLYPKESFKQTSVSKKESKTNLYPYRVIDLDLAIHLLDIENHCLLRRSPIDPFASSKMGLPSYCEYLQKSSSCYQ